MNHQEDRFHLQVIRMFCLLTRRVPSDDNDNDNNETEKAIFYVEMISSFFSKVNNNVVVINDNDKLNSKFDLFDISLFQSFMKIKKNIHSCLCDDINTRKMIKELHELISSTDLYLNTSLNFNHVLLKLISKYVSNLLHILGFSFNPSSSIDCCHFKDELPEIK